MATDFTLNIPDTLRALVIGDPIGQSLSPVIHTHWMEACDIHGQYGKLAVNSDELQAFVTASRTAGLVGYNVTVPHKTAILPFLDKVAPLARQMGAVNTVKVGPDGGLTGFNTDAIGLITHLKKSAPAYPKDKPALVIGAGGAARAAVMGLLGEQVPFVMLVNRTRAKADVIAAELGRDRIAVADWQDRNDCVSAAGVIINTTTLGMTGFPDLDLDLASAGKDTVVYDIVYKPLETALLRAAKSRGLQTVDGLGMLVYQAAAAFKIWFGEEVAFDPELRTKLEGQLL
ncbi:shikimate dehydrogenase (NADP(+)) [Kordiimonas sediminis]|uniref:Shikimate dehydrogenase (NADP(+)) n=1 Tax=Kordiimonas sediminis TaxID=1735581 RepID=A0A919ANF2_9PROT|nr:shikimate dehydrogenase [Kordiimonas sediminis]GHF15482.1 shikimate dehydrogenase (NADP(+)) [Kordiimonas sediminis]